MLSQGDETTLSTTPLVIDCFNSLRLEASDTVSHALYRLG
jgi:hypothetical protein